MIAVAHTFQLLAVDSIAAERIQGLPLPHEEDACLCVSCIHVHNLCMCTHIYIYAYVHCMLRPSKSYLWCSEGDMSATRTLSGYPEDLKETEAESSKLRIGTPESI